MLERDYNQPNAEDYALFPVPNSKVKAPLGNVTLVFTDVQGASKLWEADPKMMVTSLRMHNKICSELLQKYQGYEVKTDGDAFMYAFSDPLNAVNFCLKAQVGTYQHNSPLIPFS